MNCTFPNQVGGAEVSASVLRAGLGARGYEVQIATLKTAKTKPANDASVIELTLANLFDPWRDDKARSWGARAVWKALDFINPVVFAQFFLMLRKMRPSAILTHNRKGFSVAPWIAARLLG